MRFHGTICSVYVVLEAVLPQSVRLSDILVRQAKSIGLVMSRFGAGQIKHWAKIGKISEENPELS